MRETVTGAKVDAAPRPWIKEGWEDGIAAALIAGFFLVNLIGLDRVPFANADEAWIAEPGLRFWEGGGFVSRLHAGFFGTERHFLLHAPLFSLITGWMVWIFGHGIVQVRIVSLTMAAFTAAFTYRLGRTLLSPRHGLIAVLLLTWCRTGPYQWEARQSGIVLVDFGRYARYDIAVPFFGLIGMMLILPWLLRNTADARMPMSRLHLRLRLAIAGACAGMATASHPIGLISIATLIVSCLVAGRARGERLTAAIAPIAWMLLGASITMLPWFLHAYAGWEDLIGQMRFHGGRLTLDNPWFYASNLLTEWRRYISIGRGLQFGIPGAWLLVLCGTAGAAALVFGPRRHGVRPRLILAALLTGILLLAFFERDKFIHYFAAMWPWIALIAAIGFAMAVQSNWRIVRAATIALLVLGCLDGVRAEVALARKASERTSYAAIADRLAAQVPRDARVMGLPTWWFALEPHVRDYRSLTVPMFFLDIDDPTGRTFTERLDAIDADVLLLDQAMIDYIHGPRAAWAKGPGTRNPGAEELERFVAARGVRRVDLADPSYGRFEIYYLRR
jgi:4-amino-4-deoxy-L-arabinose transferase-like glycosyltransferase